MSEELNWLERVSQEDAAKIKPEGTGLGEDVATDIVGGDEKLENEGKTGTEHEVDLKEDTTPDDNADAAAAEAAIKVSAEDSAAAGNAEDEDKEPVTGEEAPVVADSGDEPVQAEDEPVVAVEPTPADSVAAEPIPAEPATVEPVQGEDEPAEAVETTAALTDGDEPGTVATNVEPEAQIPVEIDPVTEIQEGTAAAITEAQEEGAPTIPDAEAAPGEGAEEGELTVSEEDTGTSAFDETIDEVHTTELDSVCNDVDDINKMNVAVESYSKILRAELDTGACISPALVQAVRVGLEAFDEPSLLTGQPSLEDFKDPVGRLTVSTEFTDDVAGKAKTVGLALASAVKKLWEVLQNMLASIKDNVPALQGTNKSLVDSLASLKDGKGGKVAVKGAERLFIGGNFGGDAAANYSTLGKFAEKFLVEYPRNMAAVIDGFSKAEKKDAASLAEAIGNGFLPNQWGLLGVDKSKVPVALAEKYEQVFASPGLLGNGYIFAGMQKAPSSNGVSALSDVWKIEFVRKEQEIEPSATEVNLPSVATLKLVAKAVSELTDKVPEMANLERGSFKTIRTKASLAFHVYGVSDVGAGVVRSLTMPTGHLVGHVVNTIKVAQAFLKHCIEQHQAGAA